MKQIFNHEQLEERIEQAFLKVTPDLFDKVSQKSVDRLTEEDVKKLLHRQRAEIGGSMNTGINTDMITSIKKQVWKNTIFHGLATACVIGLVILAGYNLSNNKVDSTIGIDVNPSIEITTNKSNKVIDAVALNDDAEIILDGMDLEKVNLDVAINAIMGSMVKNGYINNRKDSILVTVDNEDEEKAAELQDFISTNIATTLEENNIQAIVYKQKLTKNDKIKALAKQYNISLGKAEFISKLMEKDSSLTIDQLAQMNMHQLSTLIAKKKIDVEEYVAKSSQTLENDQSKEDSDEIELDEDSESESDIENDIESEEAEFEDREDAEEQYESKEHKKVKENKENKSENDLDDDSEQGNEGDDEEDSEKEEEDSEKDEEDSEREKSLIKKDKHKESSTKKDKAVLKSKKEDAEDYEDDKNDVEDDDDVEYEEDQEYEEEQEYEYELEDADAEDDDAEYEEHSEKYKNDYEKESEHQYNYDED